MWPPAKLFSQHFSRSTTIRVTQPVFPQIPRVAGFFPAVHMSHHRYRTRPGATRRSTLGDWATSNRGHAMCFIPAHTFAIRTGEFPFFWVIEIGPQWSSGSCGTCRCVHHTLGKLTFAAFAIHASEVRMRQNTPISNTLLTDLRRRVANTEVLCVCDVTFRLRGNSKNNTLVVSRSVCVRVVLSFLVSEVGDHFGRAWPRNTRCSVPEIEVSVGTVHVASFAFQTLVVTNEQMSLLSQFLHLLPNGRPCACSPPCQQGFKFSGVACCTTFGPDVCLHQRQTFGHLGSDAFSLFGFAFQVQVR